MRNFFKVSFETQQGKQSAYVEADDAQTAMGIAKEGLDEERIKFDSMTQERVEQTETPFSKSWLVDGMGTLKLIKAFEGGELKVKFEIDNPELEHIIMKPSFDLVAPTKGDDSNDTWNNFDLMDAIELATGFYEELSSKLFRAPLEDTPDIIH